METMDLELREISAQDREEWAAMRAEMMLEIGFITTGETDSFRTSVISWLADGNEVRERQFIGMIGLVAGHPVATSGLLMYSSPPHPSYPGRGAFIMSMFVRPKFRGQGFGAAILTATLEAAKAAGVGNIWLLATDIATPLYRRFGFESRSGYMVRRLAESC